MLIRFGVLMAIVFMVGCNAGSKSEKVPANEAPASEASDTDGHDHAHPHDGPDRDHSEAGHAHGAGPHGGVVVDWGGGKFHVELVFEHDTKTATAYILGSDEKTAVAIDAASLELTLKDPVYSVVLIAQSQQGDAAGKASKFMGADEILSTAKQISGSITGVVAGTPYTGDFDKK